MSALRKAISYGSLGTLRQWHWISSAVCLVGMMLFAITGITLNHAADIRVTPQVDSRELQLSEAVLTNLQQRTDGPLPMSLRDWLWREHGIRTTASRADWDDHEVYLGMPKPGGDAWLSVDLESGVLLYEDTNRGWISFFNDLHKGRHTGFAWSVFLDVFSILCLIFSISGLWLLVRYARQRPSTWPLVAFGALLPLLIIILTVHH